MTIERPFFPPRGESVDSFCVPSAIQHPASETLASDSPKPAEGLSRRLMLVGLAALPAALPAAAAEPDPIFALIEAKRAADLAHLAACDVLNEAERRYGVGSDEAHLAFDEGGPACHAAYNVCWGLVSATPTTLAGVLAVHRFINERHDQGLWPEDDGLDRQLTVTTAQALEDIISKGAV